MCKCAPALLTLRDQINARWPGRDKSSDGCCGDAAHSARKSDHNPSGGYAHALDIDADLAPGTKVDVLTAALLADRRTKYVIRNARLLYPDGTNKPYTGVNAHRHHLHLSVKDGATHDTRPWLLATTTNVPLPPLGPSKPLPIPLEVEMFVYRQSSTPEIKLYEGKGRIRRGLTPPIVTDLLNVLDQRPQGPGTDRKEWVLSKETVAWLEGNA